MKSTMEFIAHTSETLDAIVIGLDVNSGDDVLAVGGSGDQAFALLEKANTVRIVDKEPEQIAYVKERARWLQERNYQAFLNSNPPYYSEWEHDGHLHLLGIMDTIRAKLGRLIIDDEPSDIFDVTQQQKGFNKIYLSNALQWTCGTDVSEYIEALKRIAINLPNNGLIYASQGIILEGGVALTNAQRILCLDSRLTKIARTFEVSPYGWSPIVYRVVDHLA